MFKLQLTGYALRPGSQRFLARAEVGQLLRQDLAAHRGDNWRLHCNDDGAYTLQHTTKKENRQWALELI